MAASPAQTALNALLSDKDLITQALSSPAGTDALVQQEVTALGNPRPPVSEMFPQKCLAPLSHIYLAGDPKIMNAFHAPLKQGDTLEKSLGDANHWLQGKMQDFNEKIVQELDINRLALDGKLSDTPRAIKFAKDSVNFVKRIKGYVTEGLVLAASLKANLSMLQTLETRMVGMIDENMSSLANLMNEICNWGIPPRLSLAQLIGGHFGFSGFQWNPFAGFKFNPSLTYPSLNNFSFAQCKLLVSDYEGLFSSTPTTTTSNGATVTAAAQTPPLNGSYGDPTQFSNPTYITVMQGTTDAPVYNPLASPPQIPTSLPPASSIISGYLMPPTTYIPNICSACAPLNPVCIQPGDPDYGSTPSANRLATLRSLLIQYVTLDEIVDQQYDPNLTAAWIDYLDLNRQGRGGTWIQNFAVLYTQVITPSVHYLATVPVPWNTVLGGSGTVDAPAAIPLIALLQGDTTNNLKWRLSYIEASLLGYARSTTWDSAADQTYLAGFTGNSLDYVAQTVTKTPTTTVELGAGTAAYPVDAIIPQSMATVFSQVVTVASAAISLATGYQSQHPQNRFTYNIFAQATLVDRFTQFWRDFEIDLNTLLAGDPYTLGFVLSYVQALDSAIDPLGDPTDYNWLKTDAASRSRTWTPGSVLPPVPSVPLSSASYAAPTSQTNGWTSGTFDAQAFLSRPDVQAQTLPVQVAMLRTNQSYAALAQTRQNLQSEIDQQMQAAQTTIASTAMPGWEIETAAATLVPPGSTGVLLQMAQVDSDQTNYVATPQSISIQTAGTYLVYAELNYDPTGSLGNYSGTVLLNGGPLVTGSTIAVDSTTFTVQATTEANLNVGDVLTVMASHAQSTPQSLLTGSSFLGLLEPTPQAAQATVVADTTGESLVAAAPTFAATTLGALAALTPVTIQSDGYSVLPVDPTVVTIGVIPVLDGLTLTATTSAGPTTVATGYGYTYAAATANFTTGALLYVDQGGVLTQDYDTLITRVRWIICVGKATSATSFIYQPHIPVNYIQNF